MGEVERTLEKLASEINAEHRAFVGAFRKTLEHGIRCGELLARAKSHCPHGTWQPWLEANFEGSVRTAQDYMRLYHNRDELRAKARDTAQLTMGGALRELAAPRASRRGEPYFELLEYARDEVRRVIAKAYEQNAAIKAKREEFASELESREDRTLSELEEKAEAIREHGERGNLALIQAYEHYIEGLDAVEGMWEEGATGEAAGWLREVLIRLSWPICGPGHGERYRLALWDVREYLSAVIKDEEARRDIGRRMNMSTATTDLTETERTLLSALAPERLVEVEAGWEEDKDYELAIRRMETFTRPADVPPSRELGEYAKCLTEAQMLRTFADLRSTGELAAAFDDLPEDRAFGEMLADVLNKRREEE